MLPGHVDNSQSDCSTIASSQSFPPYCGFLLVQVRTLVILDVPQGFSHTFHSDHSDTPPCTKLAVKKNSKNYIC